MVRYISALFLAFIAIAANPLRADLLVKEGQKVAFMGDSITQLGWDQAGGYVRLVVSGLETAGVKIEPVSVGGGGNTSYNMLNRLDRDVFPKHPDWMTLSCGVNDVDLNPGVDLESYKKNVTSIVDRVQAKGIKVIILTATPILEDLNGEKNQKLAAYNDFLRQLAKERKLPLAEVNAPFQDAIRAAAGPGNHFTEDGIHMNPNGNRIIAEGILRCLGLANDQIAKAKVAWDNAPEGAGIPVLILFTDKATVSPLSFEAFNNAVASQKSKPESVEHSLLLKSLRVVLQTHAKDDFVDPAKLEPEIEQELSRQIEAYPAGQPTLPAASASGTSKDQASKASAVGEPTAQGAAIPVTLVVKDRATLSFPSYEAFNKAITDRQIDVEPFKRNLLIKSLGAVLQAHAQNDLLDLVKLQPEIEQELSRRVLAFLADPTPPAAPAKTNP